MCCACVCKRARVCGVKMTTLRLLERKNATAQKVGARVRAIMPQAARLSGVQVSVCVCKPRVRLDKGTVLHRALFLA